MVAVKKKAVKKKAVKGKACTKRQAQDNRLGRASYKCKICDSIKADHYCKGATKAELKELKKNVEKLLGEKKKVTAKQWWDAHGRPQWKESYGRNPPKNFQARIWTGTAWKDQTLRFKAVTTFVPTKWG